MFIKAFTDGSCKGNPGIGGWGFVMYSYRNVNKDPIIFKSYGGSKKTTNNEMELKAIYECLMFCPLGCKAEIYSDSTYVIGGLTNTKELTKIRKPYRGWMRGWIYNDKEGEDRYWKTKKNPKNAEIWKDIDKIIIEHFEYNSEINVGWIKGHSNNEGNDIADFLANIYPNDNS